MTGAYQIQNFKLSFSPHMFRSSFFFFFLRCALSGAIFPWLILMVAMCGGLWAVRMRAMVQQHERTENTPFSGPILCVKEIPTHL